MREHNIECENKIPLPIKRYGDQCEHRTSHGNISNKIIYCTVNSTKWPVRINHKYEIKDAIQ